MGGGGKNGAQQQLAPLDPMAFVINNMTPKERRQFYSLSPDAQKAAIDKTGYTFSSPPPKWGGYGTPQSTPAQGEMHYNRSGVRSPGWFHQDPSLTAARAWYTQDQANQGQISRHTAEQKTGAYNVPNRYKGPRTDSPVTRRDKNK